MTLRIVRKADFGPQDAPQLTPEQIQGQLLLAEQLIQANQSLQGAVDGVLANIATEGFAGAVADSAMSALSMKAYQDSVSQVEKPLLQQIVNYANSDSSIKDIAFKPSFTATNPDAIAMARKQAGDLAVQLSKEQHEIIRNLTALSVAGNYTVPELGIKLRNHIGLFEKWAKAVENRYSSVYQGLIKQGADKTTAQAMAQKASSDYHAKLLRKRCLMIARTEVLRAENDGRWLGWKSAIDEGYANPDSHKRWIVRPIGACEICQALNGTEVPWDQPFGFGQLMPPRHPNCRCTAVLVPPPADYVPPVPTNDALKPSGYGDNNIFQGNVGGAIPKNAPEWSKPVAWNGQLDVGDLVYFDGMQGTNGYEVSSVVGKNVYYKTKSGTASINVGDLLARGKAVSIVPGAIKLAKVTYKPDAGAYAPAGAPSNAIAVNQLGSIHVGDTLYTSTLKQGQSMSVLSVDVPNNRIKVIGATGSTYWTPFNPTKNQYAIVPSANKAKVAIGLAPDNVQLPKQPTQTAAGDPLTIKPYVPQVGDVVAINGDTSTFKITQVFKAVKGDQLVYLDNGASVWVKDIIGLPAGAKVADSNGKVYVVKDVNGTKVTMQDGSIISVADLTTAKNFDVVGSTKAVSEPVAPKPPRPAESSAPFVIDANVVLGKQTGAPAGSNQKQPSGFWTGTDGKKRYVKLYDSPEQVYSELVANKIYRALGISVPETSVSVRTNPKTGKQEFLIVTEIVDNKGTIGNLGMTKAQANEIIDGFLADSWLANYDAVGTGLDNVVVGTDGKIYRIDQGGSMFYRAQGKLKDTTVLANTDPMQYYDNNAYYRKVFDKAGTKPNELNPEAFFANVDKVIADAGGLEALLMTIHSDMRWDANLLGVDLPSQVKGGAIVNPYVKLLEKRLAGLKDAYSYKTPTSQPAPTIQTQAFDFKPTELKVGDFVPTRQVKVGMTFKAKGNDTEFAVMGIDVENQKFYLKNTAGKNIGAETTLDFDVWDAVTGGSSGFGFLKEGYKPRVKSPNSPNVKQVGSPVYNALNNEYGFIVNVAPDGFVSVKWSTHTTDYSPTDVDSYIAAGIWKKQPIEIPSFEELHIGDQFTFMASQTQSYVLKVTNLSPDGKTIDVEIKYAEPETLGGLQGVTFTTNKGTYNANDWASIVADNKPMDFASPKPPTPPTVKASELTADLGMKLKDEASGEEFQIIGKSDTAFVLKMNDGKIQVVENFDFDDNFGNYSVIAAPNEQPLAIVPKNTNWKPTTGYLTGVVDVPGVTFKIKWMSGDKVNLVDAQGNIYKGIPKSALTGPAEGLPYAIGSSKLLLLEHHLGYSTKFKVLVEGEGDVQTLWAPFGKTAQPLGVVPTGWIPAKSVDAPPPKPKAKPAAKVPVQLKQGGIVTHTDFGGNTYEIVAVFPGGQYKIKSFSGKTFDADMNKLGAIGKGSIIKYKGNKLEVMNVEDIGGGDFALILSSDETILLSTFMKKLQDGGASIANLAGSSPLYTGQFSTVKPKKNNNPWEQAKVSYGVEYTHADGALAFETESEGTAWGVKASAKWRKDLPEKEVDAIQTYTGSAYDGINKLLRNDGLGVAVDLKTIATSGTRDTGVAQIADRMIDALEKSVMTEAVVVNRGIKVPDSILAAYRAMPEGALIYDGAFMSTSVGPSAAFSGNVVLRVRVEKGQQAAYVANLSYHKGEREMIIQAGSTMRVDKVHDVNGKIIVDCTIVSQTPRTGAPNPKDLAVIAVSKAHGLFSILYDLTLGRIST
jgi:hypothetical protein